MSGCAALSAAIRKVGGTAYLLRGDKKIPFTASLQPDLAYGDESVIPAGYAFPTRFLMYTSCEKPPEQFLAGDRIEFQGAAYVIKNVCTYYLKGEAVYRKAILLNESGED